MDQYLIQLQSLVSIFGNLLPISVIAAIILFITKEIFEFFKKIKANKSKVRAISYLLSEEMKLNHWSLKKLFEGCRTLSYLFEKHPKALFRVRQTRFGTDHFEFKEDSSGSAWSGHTLPVFCLNQFNNLLPSLAELNFKLAKKVQDSYEEILELEHYRRTIIIFVNNEMHEEEVFRDMTKHFISDFAKEEKDYFSSLEKGYKALTGNQLKEFKLR